jgi:hypothetical protein
MIEGRNFVRGRTQATRNGPRRAQAERGPVSLLAKLLGCCRCYFGLGRLGLRVPGAVNVRQRCSERFSALACRAATAFDPGRARIIPAGPAESWLPRLSATPGDGEAVASSFALPVRDDALTLCPVGRGCQITIRSPPEPGQWKTSPVRWRLQPPRSLSC